MNLNKTATAACILMSLGVCALRPARADSNKPLIFRSGSEICSSLRSIFSSHPNEDFAQPVKLILSRNVTVLGKVDVTARGNGTLEIANLKLRIFDTHDDGFVFEGDCLKTRLKDLNKDKIADLEISGAILVTDEKIEGHIKQKRSVKVEYLFDSASKKFSSTSSNQDSLFELSVSP